MANTDRLLLIASPHATFSSVQFSISCTKHKSNCLCTNKSTNIIIQEQLSVNIENLMSKRKFRNSSYSVRRNPLVKLFRKSQSNFPKIFFFPRENLQKVKRCPTPYSRRSKTFELYHFQSPEGRKTVQGNKFIFGK